MVTRELLPSLVNQTEAARILGMETPRTLEAWRGRREGPPYIKVGHLVRYSTADLAGWLAENRVASGAKP
ncbi:MAG: helix-turn-helix domain-containing protein [Planctomycetes bacterium]|nr:helix-turn-helix domain-containing protein [Planctomycetota bacterium]